MKFILFSLPVLSSLLLTSTLVLRADDAAANPAGHWEGAIAASRGPLDIEVDFTQAADKSWQGSISIPAQHLHGFKLDPVAINGSSVVFAMPGIPGHPSFDGALSGDSISGEFTQGGQKLTFKLDRGTEKDPTVVARKLVAAASSGDLETLKKMLGQGADPNSRTADGLTPLLAARIRGQKETYDFLVQKGADAKVPLPAPEALTDALMARHFGKDEAGAAVLVARDGKILFEKGYGLADIEQKIPVTTTTKFRIGSITKQFTSASILRLQEAGKLKVGDPLAKYYPDFPRGNEVTLERMLTHTSGIHSYTDEPGFSSVVSTPASPEKVIASIKTYPFDFNPGAQWRYSNSNFFLLGNIVEKVSGQSYDDFLKQTLLDPLGMNATGVYHNDKPPAEAALGYSYKKGGFQPAAVWDMSQAGGAGWLYSTVEDLYRWNEGLFGHKVLKNESLAAAFTPVVTEENKGDKLDDGYGYGWGVSRFRGAPEISHGGGLPGFVTNLLRLPEQNLTVVLLTNSLPQKAGNDPAELSHEIVEFYVGTELAARPPKPVEAAVPATALAAIAGRYQIGGSIMTVTLADGRVFSQIGAQPKLGLFPESETEFFAKSINVRVTFVKDAAGKVTKAIIHQNGYVVYAHRLPDIAEIKLDDAHSAAILGRYAYQPSLTLTVTRDAGRLYVQLTGQPKIELGAESETEFFTRQANARLTFVKDANGDVMKVVLHQNGIVHDCPKMKDEPAETK